MRDLGLLGEATFSAWCAEVGLVPNPSTIDRTAWDFYVEFPAAASTTTLELHESPFECKVQVKATDKQDRKWQVKLSNLKRMATAHMPSFFLFFEFDGLCQPQRAFLVHIDNAMSDNILRRVRSCPDGDKLHRRTMTVTYGCSHMLASLDGKGLKEKIDYFIDGDLAAYVHNKIEYLSSAGFDGGNTVIRFSTESIQALQDLIDVSIGIKDAVEIANFNGVYTRFGINDEKPFIEAESGKLTMPNIAPTASGVVRFRKDKLSAGLTFPVRLYTSPFNMLAPANARLRVQGDFFEVRISPGSHRADFNFEFGNDLRMSIPKFRDALRLLCQLSSSGEMVLCEMLFEGKSRVELNYTCGAEVFEYADLLRTLDVATELAARYGVTETADICFEEVLRHGAAIEQLSQVLNSDRVVLMTEFGVDSEGLDTTRLGACIFTISAAVGNYALGAIVTMFGAVSLLKDGKYRLEGTSFKVERELCVPKGEIVSQAELLELMEEIARAYDEEYSTIIVSLPGQRLPKADLG